MIQIGKRISNGEEVCREIGKPWFTMRDYGSKVIKGFVYINSGPQERVEESDVTGIEDRGECK